MSNDPVTKAMLDIGVHPAPVKREIRNVQLTDQQYDDYSRISGRMLKGELNRIVGSQAWQTMPQETRLNVVNHSVTAIREAAAGIMMGKYPSIPVQANQQKLAKLKGQ